MLCVKNLRNNIVSKKLVCRKFVCGKLYFCHRVLLKLLYRGVLQGQKAHTPIEEPLNALVGEFIKHICAQVDEKVINFQIEVLVIFFILHCTVSFLCLLREEMLKEKAMEARILFAELLKPADS